jgi:uncharacterized protein YecA (UPF0149 family)
MHTERKGMSAEAYQSIRRGIGLSCEELAAELGVSRQTIHARESSPKPISLEATLALAKVAELMGFEIVHRHTAEPTQGRNEPCACGSGRKFKHCCGR